MFIHLKRLKPTLVKTVAALMLTLTLGACVDDKAELSQVVITVSPGSSTSVQLEPGDKQRYQIELSTINDYVASFTITSFNKKLGEDVLLDTRINQKTYQTTFVFTAPETGADESTVELTFTATDNVGNTVQITRLVTVINKLVIMPEKTGIVLYSPLSGMPDALMLSDVARPFSLQTSPLAAEADIFVESNEEFNPISWASNSKTKFIRNNTFNYTEATAYSINAVYSSSYHSDVITDIQPNDIIIVGHDNTAQGVFMVTLISRGNAAGPDYMTLSYKELQSAGAATSPSPDESGSDGDDK